MTPEERQAKIEALRQLRDQNFYEPEKDNPEGLPLDEPAPEQAAPSMFERLFGGQNTRQKQLEEQIRKQMGQ
jgi:hypothetical protein